MAKKTPGLNTGSMADISFLLLTFFLLTSAINTDQGIQRRLPPPVPPDQKAIDMHKRDVMRVLVNMYDQLLVDGEPMNDVNELKERTKVFLSNPTNDLSMSDKKIEYVEELGREVPISKGVVSLQSDRGTSYKMYIAVQNQLAAAYNELREEYSRQNFGKSFENLSEREKKGVQKVIPVSVSEAEPSNYGGNK